MEALAGAGGWRATYQKPGNDANRAAPDWTRNELRHRMKPRGNALRAAERCYNGAIVCVAMKQSRPRRRSMTLAPEQRAAAKYLRVVSKSWEDEAFKQRLLGNPREVLQEHGLPMPAGSAIQVLEDTPQIMHLALPAKPAGQPADEQLARLALEGQGPSSNVAQLLLKVWDDPAFKQRLVADPRGILQEHGVAVPAGQSVRVVEDSAETL